jgi:homocysteine S-methyltransferase
VAKLDNAGMQSPSSTPRPCGPPWLDEKLAAGGMVILDGAMGTELQARGVPMHGQAWSAGALLSNPEVVRATHADYIRAGAEVIIANTFATGRHMLEPAGLGEQVAEINRRAVALAQEAREEAADAAAGPVAVAGSICEWVHAEGPWRDPDKLSAALSEQAELLAEAGVDLIALEMCQHPVHSLLAAEAALATGLPVWAGVSCRREDESRRLVTFDAPHGDLDAVIAPLAESGVAVMTVMHSPAPDSAAGLAAIKRHWSGPLGVYPESGYFIMPNWQFVDVISPEDLTEAARVWVAGGAQLLGGCCGLGPDHVRALKQAFGRDRR